MCLCVCRCLCKNIRICAYVYLFVSYKNITFFCFQFSFLVHIKCSHEASLSLKLYF